MKLMPSSEVIEIAARIEKYHQLFYTFWELASIYYADEEDGIPTAAIDFSEATPKLILNREFWSSLSFVERDFVICHECLHVLLDHKLRADKAGYSLQSANKAQDIVINELITSQFGIDRNLIRGWEKFCWIDTCFDDPWNILKNETFMYYLKELEKRQPKNNTQTLDQHSDSSTQPKNQLTQDDRKKTEELIKSMATGLGIGYSALDDQLNKLAGAAGDGVSGLNKLIRAEKPVKLRFTDLIKGMKKKLGIQEKEWWGSTHRRLSEHGLPGITEVELRGHQKIHAHVYMDVSGSCISYSGKFDAVMKALIKEKKYFDINSFSFDTAVRPVTSTGELRGGGGTAFVPIEQSCLKHEKQTGKYPDAVYIITDGETFDSVKPKYPERWVFLLIPGYPKLPTGSRTINLSDIIL